MPREPGLSKRMKAFCREYLKDMNASRAARAVGYSDTYAKVHVYALLDKGSVKQYLGELIADILAKETVTPEQVVQGYSRIVKADIQEYMTWDRHGVRLKASTELTSAQTYAIQSIEETITVGPKGTEQRKMRFRLESKLHALDSMARYYDLWHEAEKAKAFGEAFGEGMMGLLKAREQQHEREQS